MAVEAHKELQTCRAWHSVARDVHAERIRVVAADAARLETALAAGARRVEATWAAQEVLWAEREAGMLEAEAAKANGFAAREANPETVLETISRVRLNDVKEASAALPQPPLACAHSGALSARAISGMV